MHGLEPEDLHAERHVPYVDVRPGVGGLHQRHAGNGAACTLTQTTSSACTAVINKGIPATLLARRFPMVMETFIGMILATMARVVYPAVTGFARHDPRNLCATMRLLSRSIPPPAAIAATPVSLYVNYATQIVQGLHYLFKHMVEGSMTNLTCDTCDGYGPGSLV